MPLLLAIEPDSRHAAWIEEQARRLGAEVIVTGSADAAIRTLRQRVPDLVLTSLLLSPRDEGRLQDQLRQLDAAGAHVQTLVIPVMSEPSEEPSRPAGVLSRLRKKRRSSTPSEEGCDPAVFGAQIAEYLKSASKTRRTVDAAPAPAVDPEPLAQPEPVPVEEPVLQPAPVFVQEQPAPVQEQPVPVQEQRVPVQEQWAALEASALVQGSVLLRESILMPESVAEPAREPMAPVVGAAPVPAAAHEADVFAADRSWRPRRPLVIEQNEYDVDTLIALLEPETRTQRGPDDLAMVAALRQSIDWMRAGQATAWTA